MMEGLKDCPFCGGKAHVYWRTIRNGGAWEHTAHCECEGCGASTDVVSEPIPIAGVISMAMRMWNLREERTCTAIEQEADRGYDFAIYYECSECGSTLSLSESEMPNYCSYCGAKVMPDSACEEGE